MSTIPVKLFATSGSEVLARGIFAILQQKLPISMGVSTVREFANENIEVGVDNVRGHFVVVVDTHASPVSRRLIELFALLHAIKNAHPADVLVVFPYLDCGRSDKKDKPRISAMAKFMAYTLTQVLGVEKVLLLDPHSEQIKEYFEQARCPTADELQAKYLLVDHLEEKVLPPASDVQRKEYVVVFSDKGAIDHFQEVPGLLGLSQAYIDKRRDPETGKLEIAGIVGDVKGKICLLLDDEILSGGTAKEDSRALIEAGAKLVKLFVVHGILSKKGTDVVHKEIVQFVNELVRFWDKDQDMDGASLKDYLSEWIVPVRDRIRSLDKGVAQSLNDCPDISSITLTDSVPLGDKLDGLDKFEVLSVVGLLSEGIRRTVINESLSALYDLKQVSIYRN